MEKDTSNSVVNGQSAESNMREAICVSIREAFPDLIDVGKHYWLDLNSKCTYNGDDLVKVYNDEKKTMCLGQMFAQHFEEV